MNTETSKVKSLSKALKVLECFNSNTPELGITQISKMLNLNKSNVFNIITTFEQDGYLEKDENTGKYHLGLKLLEFSFVINEHIGYQRLLYDIMKDVSKKLNAITYFAILKNDMVFYLCNSYPPAELYSYPFRTIIGEKAPLYCTSLGKAMLAFLPQEDIERYICTFEKIKYTENTLTDEAELRNEIVLTRSRGYSLDNEEHEYGIKCIGVPVFSANGALKGAFSASSSTFSFSEENMEYYSNIMKEAAFHMHERF